MLNIENRNIIPFSTTKCFRKKNKGYKKNNDIKRLHYHYLETYIKKFQVAHKLLPNIPTGNITELNEINYVRAKIVCNEISFLLNDPNKNTKSG